jgi:predicted secreted acid phosphatase
MTTRGVVVFDLDSTLADTRPRRHLCPTVNPERTWEDYAQGCANDLPIAGGIRLLHLLWDAGHSIHILSWRSNSARELTIDWLARHNVVHDKLILRMPTDTDDSTAFKVDYLQRLIRIGHTPQLVVEDWPATATAIETATSVPVLCLNPRYGED